MATNKKKKKSSFGPFLGLVAIGVLGLGALAAYVKFGGASKVPTEVRKVPSLQQSNAAGQKTDGAQKVDLVTPSRDGTELKLGKHSSDVPAGEDARLFALNHFLKESKIMDTSAKAIGIEVKDHVALIDVTPSFNQSVGSFDEEALLKGICATLAQFKEIDRVQFFDEGKAVTSLGNVDLSQPIPVRKASGPDESSN
jgi:hypothetical protein